MPSVKNKMNAPSDYNGTCAPGLVAVLEEMGDLNRETIRRLLKAAEYRDDETGRHIIRVGKYAHLIASRLGYAGQYLELIEAAAPMHDIGKIGVPDSILLKPAPLSAEEFDVIKKHTFIGGRLLGGSRFALFQMSWEIAVTHHEKWDGSGYPRGISGDKIQLAGRIVALSDVFNALTSARPYKPPYSFEKSAAMIESWTGAHFDPAVARAFLSSPDEIKKIYDELRDRAPCGDHCDAADGIEEKR